MVTVVELNPNCCNSSHLPVLFAAYSASLSTTGEHIYCKWIYQTLYVLEMREKDLLKTYEDHCGLLHNIRNYEDIACKKNHQARTVFEPTASARPIQGQCFTNWAIKPAGHWSCCEFVVYSYYVTICLMHVNIWSICLKNFKGMVDRQS